MKNREISKQINWLKIGLIIITGFLVLIFFRRGYAKFCHENSILNEILNSENTERPFSPTTNNLAQNEIPNGHTRMAETQFISKKEDTNPKAYDEQKAEKMEAYEHEGDEIPENAYAEIKLNV